jgi:hypothetical protein
MPEEEGYNYLPLQSALIHFQRHLPQDHPGRRALSKLFLGAHAVAVLDYEGRTPEEDPLCWAFAWEEVSASFAGRGFMSLVGCVMELWSALERPRQASLLALVRRACQECEDATPERAEYTYAPETRKAWEVLPPEGPWVYPPDLPLQGLRGEEWESCNVDDGREEGANLAASDRKVILLERARIARQNRDQASRPASFPVGLHLVEDT